MSFTIVFWYWWALAAVLLVFEMMLPGVVFMFLAIGALAWSFWASGGLAGKPLRSTLPHHSRKAMVSSICSGVKW